jgi:hypothetical protein
VRPLKHETILEKIELLEENHQNINLINQGRSTGIHAISSTQSLTDISIKGGEALAGQVINNCNKTTHRMLSSFLIS